MPGLILPTTRVHASWPAARAQWPADAHQVGARLRLTPDLDLGTEEGFGTWVDRPLLQSDRTRPLPEGSVHATHWWIVEDEEHLGAIDLRHYVNQFLHDRRPHRLQRPPLRPRTRRRDMGAGRGAAACPAAGPVPGPADLRRREPRLGPDDRRNGGVLEDVRKTYAYGRKRRYGIAL